MTFVTSFRATLAVVACATVLSMAAAVPARADQSDVCGQWKTTDPDMLIGACTATIQSGKWSGKDLAWAYLNRCIAYQRKQQWDDAIRDCGTALQLDPTSNAYDARGTAYRKKGEYDRAIQDYD